MMGALENDEDAYGYEKPRHKVTLTRILMGKICCDLYVGRV